MKMMVLVIYLLIMNVLGVVVMFTDKHKARKHAYRVPEKTLFLVSLLGGSLGTWAGMYMFRHKTKHWYFVIGMPFVFVLHVILLGIAVYYRVLV